MTGDTIYLTMVPIYDTLSYITKNGMNADSLILSVDEKAGRITIQETILLYSGGQNRESCPAKLVYRKNRLYGIDKQGRLDKKWSRGFRM